MDQAHGQGHINQTPEAHHRLHRILRLKIGIDTPNPIRMAMVPRTIEKMVNTEIIMMKNGIWVKLDDILYRTNPWFLVSFIPLLAFVKISKCRNFCDHNYL